MKTKRNIGVVFANIDKKDYTGQPGIAFETMKRLEKEFNVFLVSNTVNIKIIKKEKNNLLLPGVANFKIYALNLLKIIKFFKENHIELIYVQGLKLVAFISVLSRFLKIRFLAYICETPEKIDKLNQKLILLGARKAEKVFVSCNYLRDIYQKLGVSKDKLVVARVGLGSKFSNLTIISKDQKKIVLFLGDASLERGFDRAVKIAEKMIDVEFQFLIRWITPECKNIYLKAKKNKNVTIGEYPDYSEVFMDQIGRADLVLIPPRYMLTRPPLSLIESMSLGKCVLAAHMANQGSIQEIMTNNKNGLIDDFKDLNKTIEKISYLLSHPEEIKRLGDNARERIRELYSENEYKKVVNALKAVLDNYYEEKMFSGIGGEYVSLKEKRALMNLLMPQDGEKILDVGAGSGRFAREIVKLSGATVFGIDLDKEMIEEGKVLKDMYLNEDQQERYRVKLMDGHDLKFKDNTFDKVYCFRVLKYYHDPYKGIDEMVRVLKKGGIFVLELTNNKSWERLTNPVAKLLTTNRKFFNNSWAANMKLADVAQVEKYLRNKGLNLVSSFPIHKLPPQLFKKANNSVFIFIFDLIDKIMQKITPKLLFSKSILLKYQK